MNILEKYYHSFIGFSANRAFCINETDFSYGQFLEHINGTREILETEFPFTNKSIGIVCFDCIETYAAIFAIWFSGNNFVPINPKYPLQRNMQIIENTNIETVFAGNNDVTEIIDQTKVKLVCNAGILSNRNNPPVDIGNNQLMYILTTSGSTGIPKHVPINRKNVEAYCNGFLGLFAELTSNDCFLQTYDLTSDAAFTGYLLPLLVGACVYTTPTDSFKFLAIAKLISNKQINWVKLTPSVLTYLTPYISKLDLKHIDQVIFGGEALPISLINQWAGVFPNAVVSNLYGPTETTISATTYRFTASKGVKIKEGIISIGKPFPSVEYLLLNTSDTIVEGAGKGELCIAGNQTMDGYLTPDENVFFTLENKKYYKTGDLIYRDKDGFLYFLGRLDDQVKINGYRVNLNEIENVVREITPNNQTCVVTKEKIPGIKRLYVFIENFVGDKTAIKQKLIKRLPDQMIPEEIFSVPEFPFTSSGKIDKKKLKNTFL